MESTEPQVSTPGFTLILTDRAAEEVHKFMQAEDVPGESAAMRVRVLPGGYSGF